MKDKSGRRALKILKTGLFILLLITLNPLFLSPAEADTLVHDFSAASPNSFGGEVSSDPGVTGMSYTVVDDPGAGVVPGRPGGKCASKVGYIQQRNGVGDEYWYEAFGSLDVSGFDSVAFYMKASVSGGVVPFILKSGGGAGLQSEVKANDYVVGDTQLEAEWRWVEIPLSAFAAGDADSKHLTAMQMADMSNMGGWHATGWNCEVWIDDIWLMEKGSFFGPLNQFLVSTSETAIAGGAFPITYSFSDEFGHPVGDFSGGTFYVTSTNGDIQLTDTSLTPNHFYTSEPSGTKYAWTNTLGPASVVLVLQADSSSGMSDSFTVIDGSGWRDELAYLLSLQRPQSASLSERGHVAGGNNLAAPYSSGCAALAFTRAGLEDPQYLNNARYVLEALQRSQSYSDSSWGFQYDIVTGNYSNNRRYTGNQVYVVMAVIYYTEITGDTRFVEMAEENIDFWLQFQNTTPASDSYGLITAGLTDGGSRYGWAVVEHQCGAYASLNNIANLPGISHHTAAWYRDRARLIKDFLMRRMYDPSTPKFWNTYHAYPGNEDGIVETAYALDAQAWTVLALGARVDDDTDITGVLDWSVDNLWAFDTSLFQWSSGIDGFSWMTEGNLHAWDDTVVWGEGVGEMVTAFDAASRSAVGTLSDATYRDYYHAQQAKMQYPNGGVAYFSVPYGDAGGTGENIDATAWRVYNEFDPPFNPYAAVDAGLSGSGKSLRVTVDEIDGRAADRRDGLALHLIRTSDHGGTITVITNTSGYAYFADTVPTGNYYLVADDTRTLPAVVTGIVVNNGASDSDPYHIPFVYSGDVNNDNVANDFDESLTSSNAIDLNNDGVFDAGDMYLVQKNIGIKGDTVP